MAAADFSRRRAAASGTTKGLFFISTLLFLVCFASSSTDKDQLEKVKKNTLRLKQQMDRLKEKHTIDYAMVSELMSAYKTRIDQMMAVQKESYKFLPDDYPSLDTFMEDLTAFMKKTKAQLDDANEKLEEQMQDIEEELATQQKLIQWLEKQHDEL